MAGSSGSSSSSQVNEISSFGPTLIVALILGVIGVIYWLATSSKQTNKSKQNEQNEEIVVDEVVKQKKKHQQKKELIIKKKVVVAEEKETHHELVVASVRGHQGDIDGAAMAPNGTMLASVGRDHTLRMWRFDPVTVQPITNAGQARIELKEETASSCAFSHDSKYLVVAMAETRRIVFYQAAIHADKPRLTLKHEFTTGDNHSEDIQTILMSPGSHPYVLTCASKQDTHVCLWSPKGVLLQRIDTKQVTHYRAAMSSDGRFFGVGTMLGDVKLYEVSYKKDGTFESANVAMSLKGHKRGVTSLCFGGSSGAVATASVDGSLRVWDSDVRYEVKEDPREVTLVQTPSKTLDLVALSPLCTNMKESKGRSSSSEVKSPTSSIVGVTPMVACSSGATLHFYRPNGQHVLTVESAHRNGVRSMAFTNDGRFLVTSGNDKHTKIWRLPS